jgi:hypothetical protein
LIYYLNNQITPWLCPASRLRGLFDASGHGVFVSGRPTKRRPSTSLGTSLALSLSKGARPKDMLFGNVGLALFCFDRQSLWQCRIMCSAKQKSFSLGLPDTKTSEPRTKTFYKKSFGSGRASKRSKISTLGKFCVLETCWLGRARA